MASLVLRRYATILRLYGVESVTYFQTFIAFKIDVVTWMVKPLDGFVSVTNYTTGVEKIYCLYEGRGLAEVFDDAFSVLEV